MQGNITVQEIQGTASTVGPRGLTPDLKIGTVTTLNEGSQATASITGTSEKPLLNLGIPKGDTYSLTSSDKQDIADLVTEVAESDFNTYFEGKKDEFDEHTEEISNDITEIKYAIHEGKINLNYWEQGTVNSSGEEKASPYRIRTPYLETNGKTISIGDENMRSLYAYKFNKQKVYQSYEIIYSSKMTPYKKLSFTLDPNYLYRFVTFVDATTPVSVTDVDYFYEKYDSDWYSKEEIDDKIPIVDNTNLLPLVKTENGDLVTFSDTFSHTNPINIYNCGNGLFTTDYNVESAKNSISKSCYISPFGNDNNDGLTKNSAYLTFEKALLENCDTVYLVEGTYYLGTSFQNNINLSFKNIICQTNAILYLGDSTSKRIDKEAHIYVKNNAYIEGVTFVGGKGLSVLSTKKPTFYRCKFTYSSANGLNFKGTNITLVECEANKNAIDGFNYHKDTADNRPTGVVEICCKAYGNGSSSNRSSNGSTSHDSGCVIRLNCEYGYCNGGIVAESQAKSYNFNVIAHDSLNNISGEELYSANFNALTSSEMWLYNCMGSGSRYHVSSYSRSKIHSDINVSSDMIYVDSTSTFDVIS